MAQGPLDTLIHLALSTRQEKFAKQVGSALRFIPEIGPLSGFAEKSETLASLKDAMGEGEVMGFFFDSRPDLPEGFIATVEGPLVQLVYDKEKAQPVHDGKTAPPEEEASNDIVALGGKDAQEMLELAGIARPGPFTLRTHELGSFYGLRVNGKLAAMAGERLRIPGHTEISAVCTHPDHLGKGYATLLMSRVMQGILERGETPFLHSRADNDRALAVYKRLGFVPRVYGHFMGVCRG